ncbi:MAG TPA: Crp/Fnr family transcriptional regulator [Terracidiphilus sp.]|nr:Crp/Fnr family transcriptional regulator [Terracidiphilus sp.]
MTPFRNKVLQNLPPATIDRLHLKPVELPVEREIEFPGNVIHNIFFIEDGLGSMTATFRDGFQVEVGLFGYESVIGISALMGTRRSLNRIFMQMPGRGYMATMEAAQAEFDRAGDFQRLALRYVQAQLTQATQSAACNARHDVEQRLARWLLLCADRVQKSTFNISQQFLADMLGVTRPSVSEIAGELRKDGLIEYKRSEVRIPSIEALEKKACECYLTLKEHLGNFLEYDSGFVI